MEGEKIVLSQRQLQRFQVMGLVEPGKITLKEAGEKKGVSYWQAKRIRSRVKEKGAQGLIHRNTGRSLQNQIYDWLREKV